MTVPPPSSPSSQSSPATAETAASPTIIPVVSRTRRAAVVVGAGAASGLASSLAVSALLLLAERVASLPVGTLYLVLASAWLPGAADSGLQPIALGLLMHLAAGAALGVVLAAPFAASGGAYRLLGRLAPALGLTAGALVWLALFVPVTYGAVLPALQSLGGQPDISQRAPVGDLYRVALADLVAMVDRVVYAALAFNMLYGMLTLTAAKEIAGAVIRRRKMTPVVAASSAKPG